jgi:hypothetical protein
VIEAKLEAGLSAQRIYQDLVGEHGFAAAYNSVKRFVRRWSPDQDLPFRRLECAPGADAQIDFGSGGASANHDHIIFPFHPRVSSTPNGRRHGGELASLPCTPLLEPNSIARSNSSGYFSSRTHVKPDF